MKSTTSRNIDSPIKDISEDFLDRYKFSKYLYSILNNLPANSNIRIGIEGPWGSGKSSVMKLLFDECEKNGHFTAYFNPWQYDEWNSAWAGLVNSIGKGLSKGKKGKLDPFKRQHFIKKGGKKFLEFLHLAKNIPYVDVASKIGDLILSPLLAQLDETKQSVVDYLNKELGDKRMFIFIDDLDRASEQVIYNLLMFLNEIVDFNKIVYVVGLDIDVTKFTLENRIKDPDGFLEKIINWSFKLPQPSEFDWNVYINKQLKLLSGGIKKESLLSLINLLPKNPRRIKLFIYYLDGLHRGFLERFDDDELYWDMIYRIQLLRNEFPKIFDYILNNKKLISDLAYGPMFERTRERSGDERNKTPEEPAWKIELRDILPQEGNDKTNRVYELYESIRNSRELMSEDLLSHHLRVIDSPDLITWKEYRNIKKELIDSTGDDLFVKLKEILFRNTSHKAVIWRQEFLKTILMDRDRLFDDAIKNMSDDDIQRDLENVFFLNEICRLSFKLDELFDGENPVYNIVLFKEFVDKFKHWVHFDRPEHLYKKLRDDEKDILINLTSKMTTHASDALIVLGIGRYEPSFSDGPDKAFEPTKSKMIKLLSDHLAQSLLNSFEQRDGISRLWPSNENRLSELNMLFNYNPSFHNLTVFVKLREIIKQIPQKTYIHDNFYEYFSMLCHAALNPTSFSGTDNALGLIKNKEFVSIIWEGILSRGLNFRNVGSLQSYREQLKNKCDVDDLLPLPEWWDKVLQVNRRKSFDK